MKKREAGRTREKAAWSSGLPSRSHRLVCPLSYPHARDNKRILRARFDIRVKWGLTFS